MFYFKSAYNKLLKNRFRPLNGHHQFLQTNKPFSKNLRAKPQIKVENSLKPTTALTYEIKFKDFHHKSYFDLAISDLAFRGLIRDCFGYYKFVCRINNAIQTICYSC